MPLGSIPVLTFGSKGMASVGFKVVWEFSKQAKLKNSRLKLSFFMAGNVEVKKKGTKFLTNKKVA